MPAASALGSSTSDRARPAAAEQTGRHRSSVTSSECSGEERSTATVLTSSARAARSLSGNPSENEGCETPRMADSPAIEDYLLEERTFPPPPEFTANALVTDRSLYEEAE